jgi:hypothetical protein
MKQMAWALFLITSGVLLGRFWEGLSANAVEGGGAGNAASGNGDVNGNGGIDISDASYLLNWLFLGGPDPVPCPGSLPDTGQTACFVCSGDPCAGLLQAFLFTQDGSVSSGCPSDANRFTILADPNSEDTVIDNCTGLQWQRFTADVDGDGTADRRTWCGALSYCFDLNFAGLNGWRLPSMRELESIVDYGRSVPAIDPRFQVGSGAGEGDGGGAGGNPNRFWSSTTDTSSPGSAWAIDFDSGVNANRQNKSNMYFIRAVRGGV